MCCKCENHLRNYVCIFNERIQTLVASSKHVCEKRFKVKVQVILKSHNLSSPFDPSLEDTVGSTLATESLGDLTPAPQFQQF